MLTLNQPWQETPAKRNADRDENLPNAMREAELLLAQAAEALAHVRENIGSEDYWVRPNGVKTVDTGLAQGRGRVVAEAVANAQRAMWQATEQMVAAASLAGGYETEES